MQMLRVSVYDTLQSQVRSEVQQIGDSRLISVHAGLVDWEEQLDREIEDHVGKLLVSGWFSNPPKYNQAIYSCHYSFCQGQSAG